jgi:hypothetical protein
MLYFVARRKNGLIWVAKARPEEVFRAQNHMLESQLRLTKLLEYSVVYEAAPEV